MSAAPDLERTVTDWLRAEAMSAGADRVLAAATERVAATAQERHLTQRVFGDQVGRSPVLRWGLAAVMLAVVVLGAAALVGALWRASPPPLRPTANGWVAFTANGTAGSDLRGTNLSRGSNGDVYVARPGAPARRIIGTEGDQRHQMCTAFSADGSRLAFVELDARSIVSTPPPRPAAAEPQPPTISPPPSTVVDAGQPAWTIVVVGIDATGAPTPAQARLTAEPSLASCAEWSPDGGRLAYAAATATDRHQLWLVSLDGRADRVGPAVAVPNPVNYASVAGAFDWAPDGSAIALLGDERLWILPTDGGAQETYAAPGARTVSWSPTGTRLALGVGSTVRIVGVDGATVADLQVDAPGEDPSAFAWSHDGQRLAWAEAGRIVRVAADGSGRESHDVDVGQLLGESSQDHQQARAPSVIGWSPDDRQLLVGVGGPDQPGAILAVPWDPADAAAVLVGPSLACCGYATWQGVRP